MGFAVPIVTGAISAYSAIKNSRAAGKQNKLMEQSQQAQLQGLKEGQQAGRGFLQMGMPATQQSLNYWGRLLSGNRAAMAQAVSGPTAQITGQFRGAERGLEHMGIRGGEAATARAELSRDRVNALSQLTAGIQPQAAQQLGDLGLATSRMGMGGLFGAAEGFGNAAETSGRAAAGFREDARSDWAGVGKSAGEALKGYKDWRAGGGRWHWPWNPRPTTPGFM